MASDNLVSLFAKQLREKFAPLIPADRPVALVDYPDAANSGDHAIWLGEKKLLADLGVTVAYECSVQTYSRDAMAAKLGNGTILMQGGGNFSDRHPLSHEFRIKVLQDFPDNKAILFPQQATFLDNDYLQRSAELIGKHPRVTLFARGLMTEHLFNRYFGSNAAIETAPDMAFMLGPQTRLSEPKYDIVWLARTDRDGANNQTEAAARLSSQAAEKFFLPRFPDSVEIHAAIKHRPPTVLLTDWYSLFFENEQARNAYNRLDFDGRSQASLTRALYMLSLGRLVITDRLHGHIFCLLLGIPHVFLNNDHGKNWDFYETWTRQSPLCRLARDPQEAWSLARNALPKLKDGIASDWSWQGTAADAPAPAKKKNSGIRW